MREREREKSRWCRIRGIISLSPPLSSPSSLLSISLCAFVFEPGFLRHREAIQPSRAMARTNREAGAPKEPRGTKRKRGASSSASQAAPTRWRNEFHQRLYSSKLIAALRRVRQASAPSAAPSRSRLVRQAADRALAVAARGRTRWSRAILAARPALRLSKARKANTAGQLDPPPTPPRWRTAGKEQSPALERKARVLGRVVPGCRKVALPALLEETSDYIAALEMQIRAMTVLVELFSASGSPSQPR